MVRVHAALFRVASTEIKKKRRDRIMARKTGTVKWFSVRRGYGFISDETEKDYFVHYSEIQTEGFKKLTTGQQVTFETTKDEQGRELAKEVYPEEMDLEKEDLE